METAKSLLAIPTGLKGFKMFRNRTEHRVYFHRDSKVFAKFTLEIFREKHTLLLFSGNFLYSQNNLQNHFGLPPRAHKSGNIDGSHAILTAGPERRKCQWASVSLLIMVGRSPEVTFIVNSVLHIFVLFFFCYLTACKHLVFNDDSCIYIPCISLVSLLPLHSLPHHVLPHIDH